MNDSFSSRRRFLQGLGMVTGALATGAFGFSSSSAFAEAASESAGLPQGATRFGPYIPCIGSTGATVMWTTEKPTAAWAEIWRVDKPGDRKVVIDSQFGLKRSKTEKHRAFFSALEPGATYAYKVFAGDQGKKGDLILPTTEKEDGTFRTLNPRKKTCEVFIANDIHADKDGAGEKLYDLLKLGADVKTTDLCFLNGDTVSYLHKDGQLYSAIIDPIKEYAHNIPFVYIRGNHENRGGLALTLPEYFPPNSGDEYYFLVRQGPVCFVILDGGEDKADTRKELGGVTDFAPYLEKEAAWLKQSVKSKEFKTARYHVALIHIPALVEEGYAEKLVRSLFVPTLAKAGVDIMISGHTHKNYFVPGKTEKDVPFPVLVNDNKGFVTVSANGKEMKVEHFDQEKKSLRVLKFPSR